MIPTHHCPFLGCNHMQLETIEDVDNGLCARHFKAFSSTDSTTLCCWSCESFIETLRKTDLVKGVEVKDDYIFAKTCPICGDVSLDSLQYVTISSSYATPTLAINELGALVTFDEQITSVSAKKSL